MQGEQETENIPIRTPRLSTFVRTLNDEGIGSPKVIAMVESMSLMQLAALSTHPGFQKILNGIALRSLITGAEISKSGQWAMKFLRDGSGRVKPPDDMPMHPRNTLEVESES